MLYGSFARLAGANAHDLLHRGHEYLAVANLAGMRSLDYSFDRALDQRVADDHLDLDLGKKIDDILGSSVELGVPFLAPEALHFRNGQTGDANLGKRFAHFVELERLDDCFDFLHDHSSQRLSRQLKITPPGHRYDRHALGRTQQASAHLAFRQMFPLRPG